ncbi:transcriptional regulator, LacI family [Granulicella pectinivorans]|jgi:LacI family transcriptional regulator|uniref:Transcriptional regulator, LacI family n=1 Tax=Granulicella pectinivorans TaxID=474950 RepID=A0A1I6M048_9BACT|nr:LacI family DNA-binding transcriptional regulator [Granulicella pectinivorans]SFS09053.1 transcriptional regulator, LacI family [Granulicella pectinivorans]
MANMKEIARLSRVSLGTVSNVLSGLPTVSEPLRLRVMAAVESLGYQPNQLARGLRRDKTNIIGMIISDVSNPFFPAVVKGAEDTAFNNGYRLFLCNSDNNFAKEETYLRELQTYLPSGLIIMTSDIKGSTKLAEAYRAAGSHVVYVDRLPHQWDGDTVTSMNEQGSYDATKYLLSLGHKRLAMISGPSLLTNSGERVAGFRHALEEAKIKLPAKYIQEGDFNKQSGYEKACFLLQMDPRPTAIFAANDLLAFGAMNAIRDMGLRCPEDISVIGFDNLDLAEVVTPPLTSVEQSGYNLGAVAAQLIADRIRGDGSPRRAHVLPTTLKLRASVAKVPKEKATRKITK